MKTTIYWFLFLFIFVTTGYTQTITASVSGNWNTANTWSLNRIPQNGDTVIIPAGRTVTVSTNINISTSRLVLLISGTLRFSGGGAKLAMNSSSSIIVFPGGSITSTGSPSQQIAIGSNTVFRGNDPPVSGPSFADGSTNGFDPFDPLPVRFLSFTLTEKNSQVYANWVTTEEVYAMDYIIQRSVNGSVWIDLDTVTAKGSLNTVTEYSWVDKNVYPSKFFYRILQRDINGRSSFTLVRAITLSDLQVGARIYASSPGKLAIRLDKQIKGTVEMQIHSINGQLIRTEIWQNPSGTITRFIHARGSYIVILQHNQNVLSQIVIL